MTFDWQPQREQMIALYLEQGLTLEEVYKLMKDEYGFTASIRSYRDKLRQWGALKFPTHSPGHSIAVSAAGSNEGVCPSARKRRSSCIEPYLGLFSPAPPSKAPRWERYDFHHVNASSEAVQDGQCQWHTHSRSHNHRPEPYALSPSTGGSEGEGIPANDDEKATAYALLSLNKSIAGSSYHLPPLEFPCDGQPVPMSNRHPAHEDRPVSESLSDSNRAVSYKI